MKSVQKPSQIINRQFSVSKEMVNISMQSPDKQLYCPKTQSQAKVPTQCPYMQSPLYEVKPTQQNTIIHPSPPQKLENSYQYKPSQKNSYQYNEVLKQHNQQDIGKQVIQYDTYKYEYSKTFAGNFQSDANQITSERKSNTTRKDGTTIIDTKENNYTQLQKSPISETHLPTQTTGNSRVSSQNFVILQPKSKLQNEINKISGSLRDLLNNVQKTIGNGKLSDSINDKMIDILSNFRKIEELSIQDIPYNDNDQKIQTMAEDYSKLKAILEQLQTKMTALVQENQKLNKNLIEQEQRGQEEIKKRQQAEERANQANKEFNRVFECLQINQKENEELKYKLSQFSNNVMKDNEQNIQQNEEIKIKYQNLQKDFNSLDIKYRQLMQEKSIQKEIPKSPVLIKSIQQQGISKQQEQLELKVLQLQIENDNLKAEIQHNQVDFKAIDSKNEMIQKLEEKIKSILKEKTISEDQSIQICHNLEILNEQLKNSISNKELECSNILKQKNEVERELKNQINNLLFTQKGSDEKLQEIKIDYQKLLDDYKLLDQKKNKSLDDLKNADKQIDYLSQENNIGKQELKKKIEIINTLQMQIEQSNQQLQQQHLINQQLLQQIDQFKLLEQQLRQECDKLDKQLQSNKQEMKYQLNELNEMLNLQNAKTQQKEKQLNELIEEMGAMKDQYEVQKKVCLENVNDLERRLKNQKIQQEELLQIKEQEISDFKLTMDQQIKMLDKRNALSSFDFDQREIQLQQDIQQKNDQLEQIKQELEKLRSTNFNIQEELMRAGILLNQHQATITSYRNELQQSKQEQIHLTEMLKKRKEETEQLHQNLEEIRKEQQSKKINEDSRRSILRQQDLQIALENLQRDNLNLQQKLNSIQNDLNRKTRDLQDKNEEYLILKRKYDETLINLERLEKRWGDKIDQHRKN